MQAVLAAAPNTHLHKHLHIKTKTPLMNASTEALNQGSCWRRMGDSNPRGLAPNQLSKLAP